ncbi:alkaline phosphatase family protein [Candidatus Altiarchaeota archaeon]
MRVPESLQKIIASRLIVSLTGGILSFYILGLTLATLLFEGVLVHRYWITSEYCKLAFMFLSIYGIYGGLSGLAVYFIYWILSKVFGRVLSRYYQLVLSYLLVSLPLEYYVYWHFFASDGEINFLTTSIHAMFFALIVFLPIFSSIIRDSVSLLMWFGQHKTLRLALMAISFLSLMAGSYWVLSPLGGGPDYVPVEADLPGKVVIFGFDGATWDLMQPLLDGGKLPNIQKLMDSGVYGNFTSIKYNDVYMSPVVWTSIFTGKVPEKHGITDYILFVLDDTLLSAHGTPPTSSFRRTKALWNILSDHDVSVGFVGLWSTWPAERVKGFMVSDHMAYLPWHVGDGPAIGGLTYPASLHAELSGFVRTPADVGEDLLSRFISNESLSRLSSEDSTDLYHTSYLNRLKLSLAVDNTYIDSARYIKKEYDPDVLYIYMEGSDIVEHFFWGFKEPEKYPEYNITAEELKAYAGIVDDYYVYYDGIIGEFMQGASPDTTFIILSDHGLKLVEPNDQTAEIGYFADHSGEGVLIMSGPRFRRDERFASATVLDFTPTFLHSIGLPGANDMDGRILWEVFTDDYQGSGDEDIGTYDAGFEREFVETPIGSDVEDRLRELGYLK